MKTRHFRPQQIKRRLFSNSLAFSITLFGTGIAFCCMVNPRKNNPNLQRPLPPPTRAKRPRQRLYGHPLHNLLIMDRISSRSDGHFTI
ncbi:hypothetical protein PGTUg99_000460 [Puccinia graminis f. sp. tritici]|uniref:Uncharacterized protein n=1 Tax=Puccinia graminis f. sp. tritici TaxID=56615 RepID=A0A5B0P7Q1_PUCGR|nr:hypothetical protein PGTUg99_000460 [Puccinia graminis f. sp. tritici]